MIWKFIALALLGSIATAQSGPPADPGLKILRTPSNALVGYLGNPAAGEPATMRTLIWHPGGRIVSSQPYCQTGTADFQHLGMWERDPVYPRFLYKGTLDVGGTWCLSTKGDLLCAQSPLNGIEAGDLGCYRLGDAKQVWTLPREPGSMITEVAFSTDDKTLVIVVNRSNQTIVRLHDASTGTELRRVALPDAENRQPMRFNSHNLVIHGAEMLLGRRMGAIRQLLRIPFATLQPETVPCPFFNDNNAGLVLSPNGHWMAVLGATKYAVYEEKAGAWVQALAGDAPSEEAFPWPPIAAFSPDNHTLLISLTGVARVINLDSRKTVKSIANGCRLGAFSPDGKSFLAAQHSHIEVWDTKDWLPLASPVPPAQHQCPVKGLRFLPDGKTLASWDHNSIILWDMATRQPRAVLKPKIDRHCESSFTSLAFAGGGHEIMSADGWDFLSWKLPSILPGGSDHPPVITSVLAFPGVASKAADLLIMSLATDEQGRNAILNTEGIFALRDLKNPATVRTLNQSRAGAFAEDAMDFSPDGSTAWYGNVFGAWKQLDLASGKETDLATVSRTAFQYGRLVMPRHKAVLSILPEHLAIVEFATGKTLQDIAMPSESLRLFRGRPTITPDEKHCAVMLQDSEANRSFCAIWDLETGTLLALNPLPSNSATCMAFSPDGTLLACGHNHTAISVWSVPALIASAQPELILKDLRPAKKIVPKPTAAAPPPPPSPSLISPIAITPELAARRGAALRPGTQLLDLPTGQQRCRNGEQWEFLHGGAVSGGETLPVAGRLLVAGKDVSLLATRFISPTPDFLASTPRANSAMPDAGATLAVHEGTALTGDLIVTRLISQPQRLREPGLTLTDMFCNRSAVPLETQVEFQAEFPPGTQGLVDSSRKKVPIEPGGRLSVDPNAEWVAPFAAGNTSGILSIVRFRSRTASAHPELWWDEARHLLRVIHVLKIPPYDRRYLMYGISKTTRDPQALAEVFTVPRARDLANYVSVPTQNRGVNFGPLTLETLEEWVPDPVSASHFEFLLKQRTRLARDHLGFAWSTLPEGAKAGELGARSVCQLWVEGRALPLSWNDFFPHDATETRSANPYGIRGLTLDGQVAIRRDVGTGQADDPKTVWSDAFTNFSNDPIDLKVSLISTFNKPPAQFLDAEGKPHPIDQSAIKASELGGGCVIVAQGDQQPATLLTFYRPGSEAEPTVHWIGNEVLAIDYVLHLKPHNSALLRHGACQRLLGAFPTLSDALADAVSFKPEADFPHRAVPANYR